MAYDTTPHDIYRGTTGLELPTEMSTEVWQKMQEESAIMRLAQREPLKGSGKTIPIITSDPEPGWTAESTEKPVGTHTFSTKKMTPYKLAIIVPISMEFRRDHEAIYNQLTQRIPKSFARKFDKTVFFGSAPGSNFDTLVNSPEVNLWGNEWEQLVEASALIADKEGELNGWAMSPRGKAALLQVTDTTGRPIFVNGTENGSIGSILDEPVYRTRAVYDASTNLVGFAGDWTKARYGIVESINMSISEEATINDGTKQINLWQRNMFAIRCEAEFGFIVEDDDYFVKLKNYDPTTATKKAK